MNHRVLWAGGTLTIPLLAFLALGLRHDPRTVESPLVGRPAPSFILADLDGRLFDLGDLRGKPVVLNFWASWCRPCAVEHASLRAAARRHGEEAHFVGVIYHDLPDQIRRFVERRGAWGPALIDEGSSTAIAYGVYGVPETYFIDADGVIARKVSGALSTEQLTEILQELPP